ncbi:MAG: sugar transferase [Anaerolineae bacterium]|nr:sugar transferase [Anaerolineae bacterium]
MRLPEKYRYRAYLVAKRWFDLGISSVAIILLAIPMLIIAIVIKLDSPGAIWRQEVRIGSRVRGKGGRKSWEAKGIVLYEFRTTSEADPNSITRIGGVLRRFSLHKLPRLINVWRDDISLVGPSPALPSEVDRYNTAEFRRLEAKQGWFGWSQLKAPADAAFEQILAFDVWYADNANLWLDAKILLLTPIAVLRNNRAAP